MSTLQSFAVASFPSVARKPSVAQPLIRKLERLAPLSDADKAALEEICADAGIVAPRTDLIRIDTVPGEAVIVLNGFASRYRLQRNGNRQIIALLVAGDLCDLDLSHLGPMDHTVGTLSSCLVARLPRLEFQALLTAHPQIACALRLTKLIEEATLRERIVCLGCRSAPERLAHLLCRRGRGLTSIRPCAKLLGQPSVLLLLLGGRKLNCQVVEASLIAFRMTLDEPYEMLC